MLADSSTIRVAICVITYKRPVGLARLLESLAQLVFPKTGNLALEVIVVDNDRAGAAQVVAENAAAASAWPLRYAIEPQQGISFARNRAVALAAGCDFLAFIDDDEIAEPSWLDELLAAQQRFDADIVTGPALAIFEAPPPAWMLQGRFVGVPRFDANRRATGDTVKMISTANILLRQGALKQIAGPFNPRFAISGGSDTFLGMQLIQQGARSVWCAEAIAREYVPDSRVSATWIIKRAYRVGNIVSRCEQELQPTARRMLERAARGGFCIAIGVAGLLPALLGGRARQVRALSYAARGAGILAGLAGHQFEEYRTVHGS